jgi:hypothetical protein
MVILVTIAGNHRGKEIRMSAEENRALARLVIEEMFNESNLDLADEVFAPDYVDHDLGMPEGIHGSEGFKEFVSMYRTAFPDLHVQIEDVSLGSSVDRGHDTLPDPARTGRRPPQPRGPTARSARR